MVVEPSTQMPPPFVLVPAELFTIVLLSMVVWLVALSQIPAPCWAEFSAIKLSLTVKAPVPVIVMPLSLFCTIMLSSATPEAEP